MPPESAAEKCAFCVNIFQKSSNPRILIRKVQEENSVSFMEICSENPAISKYLRKVREGLLQEK